MPTEENDTQRSTRILSNLNRLYPGKVAYDLDGRAKHFVCEIDPVSGHPAYDRAVEVIIESKPHYHKIMTQTYTMISGSLEIFLDDERHLLSEPGQQIIVKPGVRHWAKSSDEAMVEIYSVPGWTAEDHIAI